MQNLLNSILTFDSLIHLSNIVFLLAFSVRDVLKLRVLSIGAYIIIFPYYYFQPEPLWPPIYWAMAFIIVNGYRVVLLILERRPVTLTGDEERLYHLVFSSLDKRQFMTLLSFGEWKDVRPGEFLLRKGQPTRDIMVMVSGEIEAILDEKSRVKFRPGDLVGTIAVYADLHVPIDVVVVRSSKIVVWQVDHVREFAANKPELRATLANIVNVDLGKKLQALMNITERVITPG